MKETDYKKKKRRKTFWAWMFLGFILFSTISGSFVILAGQYVCNINTEALSRQSDQITFSDGALAVLDSDTQLYFEIDKDIFINYFAVNVKKANMPTINGRLYYTDCADDFNETNVVNFYLKEGYNEIRTSIGRRKCFRLDILGGGLKLMP